MCRRNHNKKASHKREVFLCIENRLQNSSRRQIKVFRCSSFSKMLPRCGRAAHICGANETVQESVSKLKESQLPLKSEGCNDGTRFQGQLRFPGKLGMCPSLAEPDSGGFSKSIVSKNEPQANKKFFGAAILQKCCRGVGEQPTFAKQMKLYNEMEQKSRREPQRIAIALKIERL